MKARLIISDTAYALHEERDGVWIEATVLPGGAAALLPSGVDELQLEAGIERAEDWLMPHAARMRGAVMEVQDGIGRLKAALDELWGAKANTWSVADVEEFFARIVLSASGRAPSAAIQSRVAFAADVLLLRELAHHAQLSEVRLLPGTQPGI